MQITPYCTPDVSVKTKGGMGQAVPVRCKRWSCEHCAKINKRRVIHAGVSGRPRAMLTLTVSSKHYETPDDAAHALKRGLRLLRLHLSRHPKLESFEYLAVFEEHKSGYPHMHLLITGKFIPWKWLREKWELITGSTHIDIRKLRTHHQAARYVSKYITKGLATFEGCKRWWRSHGYPRPIEEASEDAEIAIGWGRYEGRVDQMAFNLRACGYKVETEPNGKISWLWPEANGPPPGWMWAASGGLNQMRSRDFRR